MAHVTIDHSPAAWAVNNPVIRACISCLCRLVIIMPAWCKARCPTNAACDCLQASWLNISWKLCICWLTSVLFLFGLPIPFICFLFCSLAHFIPHLLSASLFCFPSLHPSMYPVSFPEQPVDNSLPISWVLTDQQLCVQLPAQMAPEPNHKLGKWGLPQMVRCLRSYVYTQLYKVHVQTHFAPNTPLKYLTCTYENAVKKNYWESRIIQVFFFF